MNNIIARQLNDNRPLDRELLRSKTPFTVYKTMKNKQQPARPKSEKPLPEILFITSFPPRECGIATYSQDLMKALNHKFGNSFTLKVCAVETENEITLGLTPFLTVCYRSIDVRLCYSSFMFFMC